MHCLLGDIFIIKLMHRKIHSKGIPKMIILVTKKKDKGTLLKYEAIIRSMYTYNRELSFQNVGNCTTLLLI